MVSNDQIYDWLASVNDPEVPVLSILDLGVVRGVKQLENGAWEITITPTYSFRPVPVVFCGHSAIGPHYRQQIAAAANIDQARRRGDPRR